MEVAEHHGLREGAAVPRRGEDARVHREPGAEGPGDCGKRLAVARVLERRGAPHRQPGSLSPSSLGSGRHADVPERSSAGQVL